MQIQAYLDNVFDVGGLLEDAETKNAALEKVEELEEHLSHVSAPPSLDGPPALLLVCTYEIVVVHEPCTYLSPSHIVIRNQLCLLFHE